MKRGNGRGFALMEPEKLKAICSMGGKAVPNDKRSFSKNRDLAASAGRKGGIASHGGRPRAVANVASSQSVEAA